MKRLTLSDRKVIEKMKNKDKAGIRSIGRAIGVSHSVIIYEFNHHCGDYFPYNAEKAHAIYLRNQEKKGNKSKIEYNDKLREFITEKLKYDWSPEEISGRLKRFYKHDIGYVCHETIYEYVYSEEGKRSELWKHLRRHRKKRIKKGSRKNYKKIKIPNRISIHDRPEIIDKRLEFGHWETDSMIFSKQKGILSVQVERKSRLTRFHKCPNKTAEETNNAIYGTIDSLPTYCFKSITYDNGTEGARHNEFKINYGINTYFCDPYKSYQKGSVENMNMFIRQYLPRSTNMSKITHKEIHDIQEKLNNRPRKCLNYLTPNEYVKLVEEIPI